MAGKALRARRPIFRARDWLRNREGVAAVEFAMALPILLTLYLGGYLLCDAISCNRKVTITTRELTDMTTRCPAIISSTTSTDPCAAVTILAASAQVMVPYSTAATWERISEVQVTSATQAKVIWSQSNAGATVANGQGQPLETGDTVTLPSGMVSTGMMPNPTATPAIAGAYLVVGEVNNAYVPPIGVGNTSAIALYDRVIMSPRLAAQVPLQ